MSVRDIVLSGAGAGGKPVYVDDVFSTYTYDGTGSPQTIPNGINLLDTGEWSLQSHSQSGVTVSPIIKNIAFDSSGNMYTATDAATAGSVTHNGLVKYDPAGNVLWATAISQGGQGQTKGVVVDSSDNVYLYGQASAGGLTGPYGLLVKYNSTGTKLWQRKIQFQTTYGTDIYLDSNQNVLVATYGGYNAFIASISKYDPSGTRLWTTSIANNSLGGAQLGATSFFVDSSDNSYLSYSAYDYNASMYKGGVVKYNSAGTLVWNTGTNAGGGGGGVTVDSLGNVYALSTVSDIRPVIIKFNSSGTLVTSWIFGSSPYVNSIWCDSSDNIHVLMAANTLVGFTSAGALLYQKTFTNFNGYKVFIKSNNFYITGYNTTSGIYKGVIIKTASPSKISGSLDNISVSNSAETFTANPGIFSATPSIGYNLNSVTSSDNSADTTTVTPLTFSKVSFIQPTSDGGGLVWTKARSGTGSTGDQLIMDSARGENYSLSVNSTTVAYSIGSGNTPPAFYANGYKASEFSSTGAGSTKFVSWTFKKQPKFFDIVTYTGNGAYSRSLPHALTSAPGMIMVKCTSATGDWFVYHRSLGYSNNIRMNTTAAYVGWTNGDYPFGGPTGGSDATASNFMVGGTSTNANGATYVAYIYAHNAGGFGSSGTDNIISCGTFTGSSTINLGYEPQYVLVKNINVAENWYQFDNMRSFTSDGYSYFNPNTTTAEVTGATGIKLTSTGFTQTIGSTNTYIYVAIRRPNKPPTTGTQVYKPIARTGTGAIGTSTGFGNVTDLVISSARTGTSKSVWTDRLRGATNELSFSDTTQEASRLNDITGFDSMTGFNFGTGVSGFMNAAATTYIDNLFKRAPGFFDIVCYVGTGTNLTLNHNLSVIPELIIGVDRSIGQTRPVGGSIVPNTNFLILNTTAASSSTSNVWNNTSPTASVFTVGAGSTWINNVGDNNVAYLFATLAGISKVSSYTGNGSSQTIACGFTTGARFILIKCTSSVGDWYVWNSATGIIAGSDPHLSLNTTVAEVTTDDSVDPDNSGFIINQVAATNINVTSATYIFLAIA